MTVAVVGLQSIRRKHEASFLCHQVAIVDEVVSHLQVVEVARRALSANTGTARLHTGVVKYKTPQFHKHTFEHS